MTTSHYNYDDVPYPDLCYAHSHPARLGAIATLLGLNPAPPEHCRVLELGCAGGGNLIPMAYGLPGSTFVGVDNSIRQIQSARKNAAAIHLENITFHAVDILDITPAFGQFDYIIAHGVYSWVPPEVRDRVLAICHQNLAPQGLAYVSYNTLPGWHMLLMVREMMLYHTRYITEPGARVAEARRLISFLAESTPKAEESAYAAFLNTYLEMRPKHLTGHTSWEDAALLHDELEAVNDPVYFHQFIDHAARHDLQYVAEANFPQVMANDLSPETRAQLQQLAHDTIEMEQYLDFLRHNTFRRTLLCHADVEVDRTLRPARVQHLYASSRAQRVEDDPQRPQVARFESGSGATLTTDHPVAAAALQHLCQQSPRAVAFKDLLAVAARQLGMDAISADDTQKLAMTLLQGFAYSAQLVDLYTFAPDFTVNVSERPLASPLARLQAQASPIVSNLRHERVELDPFSHTLLPLLDGRRDQPALLDDLWKIERISRRLAEVENPEAALERELSGVLNWMARTALLLE